jgi:epoxyqueuosine reductase
MIREMKHTLLSRKIRRLAESIGLDTLGFAKASAFSDYALANSIRRDPKLSLSNARTIIVAGIYIGGVVLPKWADPSYGRTSRLYLSEFFLDVVKPIEPIADYLRDEGHQAIICDDSREEGSILPLKLAAIRAGLGWQGKHSLFISRKYGTFLALGGIITDANLEHNTKEESNRCHKCDKCQQACPLGALDQPYVLKREKCLSYLLQSEHLPGDAQSVMENRVGDCEICQQACPWNSKHLNNPLVTDLTESFQKEVVDWEDLFFLPELAGLSESKYKKIFGQLNTHIPHGIFHRNVMIAMERAKRIGETDSK